MQQWLFYDDLTYQNFWTADAKKWNSQLGIEPTSSSRGFDFIQASAWLSTFL